MQDSYDLRGIPLDKAGIKDIAMPLTVFDKIKGMQHVTARVSFYTSLPENRKGVHLSKLMNALNSNSKRILTPATIKKMAEEVSDGQDVFLRIDFTYFIDKQSPVSGTIAPMDYRCAFVAELKENFQLKLEAKVPVMTLCPDSKALSKYGAHNQRSIVTIQAKGDIWFDDLISYAEKSASSEIFQFLSKEDDKFVTEKSYENPKFVEDLVRDIVIKLKDDTRVKWFYVDSEDFESNHNYNAFASFESKE
jgi:GTP cyclohydrolase I